VPTLGPKGEGGPGLLLLLYKAISLKGQTLQRTTQRLQTQVLGLWSIRVGGRGQQLNTAAKAEHLLQPLV
jgi:hypothetical protein